MGDKTNLREHNSSLLVLQEGKVTAPEIFLVPQLQLLTVEAGVSPGLICPQRPASAPGLGTAGPARLTD